MSRPPVSHRPQPSQQRGAWLALLAAMPLAGCISLPPLEQPSLTRPVATAAANSRPDTPFIANGRFALRYETGNAAGRFTWLHDGGGDSILLSDPLGRGIAEIVRDADGARLTTADQRLYSAADADSLVRDTLGYPLPVAGLTHWLTGHAMHPEQAKISQIDTLGRPQRLIEAGWLIDYRYEDAVLPRQVTAHWGDLIEIRLLIEDWQP